MDSLHTLSFPFLLAVLTCMLQSSFAQSTGTTPTPSATATPSVTASYGSQATSNYPSGGADGPGTVANPVPTTTAEQNDAGASGRSSGSFNLSVGALVAIGIIVGVVVLVAISSSILFYLAKKKQWAIRDSIRASFRARRLRASYKSPTSAKISSPNSSKGFEISTPPASKRKGVVTTVRETGSRDVEKGASREM